MQHLRQGFLKILKRLLNGFLLMKVQHPIESRMKWELIFRPTLVQQLSVKSAKVQTQRRMGLLRQLCATNFLLCQGL